MAVYKCKMCGGDLSITDLDKVVVCDYCGTTQTVPSADSEKKLALFNRANRLRLAGEFDKASSIYENIVAEFPEEAEAYWGIVLCKYGIEYVDDPATGKKIPTCQRSSFESVFENDAFDQACENADAVSRRVYREEAKQIEEIRKGILEVSSKEEPYDIFICYKETDENGDRTIDSAIAQDVYDALTEKGYRVFFSRITLEDKLGQEYEPYIFAALHSAKVMLVFGTDYEYFNAVWVKNEWSRFLQLISAGQKKVLIPCYKGIDAYDMPKEFARLQSQDMGKVGAIQDLLRGIEKILPKREEKKEVRPVVQQVVQQTVQGGGPNVRALLDRGQYALEDGLWEKAKEYFDQVLNMDAKNHDAYLGIALADEQLKDRNTFADAFIDRKIEDSSELKRARAFADSDQRAWWSKLDADRKAADERKAEANRVAEDKRMATEKAERERKEAVRKAEEDRKRKEEAQAQEDADKVIAAIRKKLSEKGPTLDAQLAAARQRAAELTQLCAAYDGIQAQRESRKAWLKQYDQQKNQLQKQRSELGLFAGKEKKQIDLELAALDQQTVQISREQSNLYKQLQGLETKAQAEQAKAKAEADVSKLEQKILEQKANNSSSISYETAVNVLSKNKRVLKLIYQKDADLLRSNPIVLFQIAQKYGHTYFGHYPQKKSTVPEPIEWEVLKRESERILLISKYALDCKPYHTTRTGVTWETCSLRKWLNSEFLNAAFTTEEQKLIPTVTVSADKNPKHGTSPGKSTRDKIFLLSIPEVYKYFESDVARNCAPTDYTIAQGAHTDSSNTAGGKATCWWWLRSPGYISSLAAVVGRGGSVSYVGGSVDDDYSVRPALWINLGS